MIINHGCASDRASDTFERVTVTMAMLKYTSNEKRAQATNNRFCLSKTFKKHRSRLTDLISYGTA